MKERCFPRPATWILHRLNADPALIGDLHEEYHRGRSLLWVWRQVAGAATVCLAGRARDPQPHRRIEVNLTAAPRGSAAGGLGLLALAALVTIVNPHAWWLLAIAAAGGIGLGVGLILVNRHRVLRHPPRGRHGVIF